MKGMRLNRLFSCLILNLKRFEVSNGTNKFYPTQLDPPPSVCPDVATWGAVVGSVSEGD